MLVKLSTPPSLYLAGSNLKVSNFTWSSLDILLCAVVGWSSSIPSTSGGPCDLVLGLLIFAVMLQVQLHTIILLSLTFCKASWPLLPNCLNNCSLSIITGKISTSVHLNISCTCILLFSTQLAVAYDALYITYICVFIGFWWG